jgi:hypothetical protein
MYYNYGDGMSEAQVRQALEIAAMALETIVDRFIGGVGCASAGAIAEDALTRISVIE